jgi:hypothetical protein
MSDPTIPVQPWDDAEVVHLTQTTAWAAIQRELADRLAGRNVVSLEGRRVLREALRGDRL